MMPDAATDLLADLDARRASGERIVLTNGCFDLLHPGHLDILRRARQLGDCLVVGVNSDTSVRRLKGRGRPVLPLPERLELLRAVRWVDHVVPFEEDTPLQLVELVRPDVYAKGADWRGLPMPEADAARAAGGEVVWLELVPGFSTTAIIERIRAIPLSADDRTGGGG